MKSILNNPRTPFTTAFLEVTQAEMVLWLPNQPQIRRDIFQVSQTSQTYHLHPDPTAAGGISLNMCQTHFHASMSGPARADIEVECIVHEGSTMTLPIWAMAQGSEAEANVWDNFGKLLVPDLLARGVDAPDLHLSAGKYMIIASVTGNTTMVIGAGVAKNEITLPQAQSIGHRSRAIG